MALSATVRGSSDGTGNPDVLQRPPQAPLHAPSVGALAGDGAWSGSSQPFRQMGGSAEAIPRQVAPKCQGSQ
ncbi:hypothetical protein SLEP1_g34127 [Rubroshorea leprosula]|uniref:Uncharacterized protein n=1 Tax=Rubroshorea leprosula TaxID=152421 RepID=A0AAV5KJ25_9ROSI|nr:hypothetical protein SLEP1_g34127 [Rubroshorea leprosula]